MLEKEEVGVICMAWRILYAETVTARVNDRHLNLPRAYAKLIQLNSLACEGVRSEMEEVVPGTATLERD
jgi:hypothetical protein